MPGIDSTEELATDYAQNEIGEDLAPTEAIVAAVAAETGRSPLDLRPLYDVFDTDALDTVFEGTAGVTARFVYEGCDVVVTPLNVYVRPQAEAQSVSASGSCQKR